MGTVYLGHDPFKNRDVAIKIAHPETEQIESARGRYRKLFFNEATVASRLKHPNIVEVFDVGIEEDVWYIVMEYVAGARTLHDFTRADKLMSMEDVVLNIFKCAKGLDYAHRHGVVHRDIKPKNIMLTADHELKLCDFSIALTTKSDVTESTQIHGYVGSPLYMSPEQIRMENVTNQTDIFSLGVVLFELITGQHPFEANSLPAITHKITSMAHPPLRELRSDAPKILAHIVDRTLSKDPATRYKMGLDLAADLSLVFARITPADEQLPGGEKFNLVNRLRFFDDFSEAEIWEVINASLWQEFPPDYEIILEGDVDNCFYVIITGEVMVRKGTRKVDTLMRGDCFGEMGFIARQQRSASVIATSPVTVMQVRATLMERASLNCQLRFHKVFLNTMVRRLSRTTEQYSQSGNK